MGMGMGMNPQQMMAAQAAAAEAYQRAMVSFSQAGSHAGSQTPSEAGDMGGMGSRMGATSPMPGMGMMNPMMMNPMMGNPMMGMGGMGGMGMMGSMTPGSMGGMSPGSMASSPGMFPQQFPPGGTPSLEQHGLNSRFSSTVTTPVDYAQDRSASQSRQSSGGPQNN